MQPIPDGPVIPFDVTKALDEGKLILFCGAGISMKAGLPSFERLVELVRDGLGASFTEIEQSEFDNGNYDRVLGLLEGENRFGAWHVRHQVQTILATPSDPDLSTHEALLTLARDLTGEVRLVTTNFDLLFEEVGQGLSATAAPLLPVPKHHKWKGLVHLHGRLEEEDPDGKHLVLSSADFGVAYLVERWASRFVSELFNQFTVLFVGYGVNDPVMRYLVDALAAERRIGARIGKAYAFAGYDEKGPDATLAEWRAKNIVPILYDESRAHAALHDTLREWAGIWRGGLNSKRSLVSELGSKNPEILTPREIRNLCWAVSDPVGAWRLAELGKDGHIGWLDVFERKCILGRKPDCDRFDSAKREDSEIRKVLDALLASDLNEHEAPHWVADSSYLVGHSTTHSPALHPVKKALGKWLAANLGKHEVIRWVVSAGGHLHPHFSFTIEQEMDQQTNLPESFRKVWRIVIGPDHSCSYDDRWARLSLRIERGEWSPSFRLDLLAALSPCLKLRPSRHGLFSSLDATREEEASPTVSSLVWADCETYLEEHTRYVVNKLRASTNWQHMLGEIASELIGLLQKAMHLQEAVENAGSDSDNSFIHLPSIAPHGRNDEVRGWAILIDLVREAFDVLISQDVPRARILAEFCAGIPFPVFRRLVLYVFERLITKEGHKPDTARALDFILSDPRNILWRYHVKVELFRLLPTLWPTLNKTGKKRLTDAIAKGTPRDFFREDLDPGEWEETRDRMIWRRLMKLHQAEPPLDGKALRLLQRLQQRYLQWQLTGEEKEDYPFWSESSLGLQTDFTPEALCEMDDQALLLALTEPSEVREGRLDTWQRAAAIVCPDRVISFLSAKDFNAEIWGPALRGFREAISESSDKESRQDSLIGLLEVLSDNNISPVIHPLGHLVEEIAKGISSPLRDRLLVLWDRIIPVAIAVPFTEYKDQVSAAINHPVGDLAAALFYILRSYPLEPEQGVPGDIRTRLERLLAISEASGRHGRVLVASRLHLLHYLQPGWTHQMVVPLFDWDSSDDALGAWQGYLWSPRMPPALWLVMKAHFLAAFSHFDELGDWKRTLAQLFAVVAVEITGALTHPEARACLKQMDEQHRAEVVRYLTRRLEDAEERADVLWRDRIGPWIKSAWPRDQGLRGPQISEALAWAAIAARDAYPEAVALIVPLLTRANHGYGLFNKIKKVGHLRTYREASLELIDALTPDDPEPFFGNLSECLSEIAAADPTLTENARFRRLNAIALRRGL